VKAAIATPTGSSSRSLIGKPFSSANVI